MQAYCLVLQAEGCNSQSPVKFNEYLPSGPSIAFFALLGGEPHKLLNGQLDTGGFWNVLLDDRTAIREQLQKICLNAALSIYQRPAEKVTEFEGGAQLRSFIELLQARF